MQPAVANMQSAFVAGATPAEASADPPPSKRPRTARPFDNITIVLHPACTQEERQAHGHTSDIGSPADAASIRVFHEKQRAALAELHALYQEEYSNLQSILKSRAAANRSKAAASTCNAQPLATSEHTATVDNQGIASTQPHDSQLEQPQQPAASPSPRPAGQPSAPEASAGCSADTSAGRAVGSLNNWMGAHASTGTPQSGYRANGPVSGPASTKDAPQAAAAAEAVVPLTPIAEEPPGTPSVRAAPGTEQADPDTAIAAATPMAGFLSAAAPQDAPSVSHQPSPPRPARTAADTDASEHTLTPLQQDNNREPQGNPGGTSADPDQLQQTPASNRIHARPPLHQQQDQQQQGAQEEDTEMILEHDEVVLLLRPRPGGLRVEPEAEAAALPTLEDRTRFGGAANVERILRLENLASAITEQELDMAGALACLVGRKGRYLIRQNTVLLGRNTDVKGEVDVDLSQEGPADQVSRRQAYLMVQADGQWSLTNAGRRAMRVDGAMVGQFESVRVQHGSLLEVGGLQLMLMVNWGAVERMLRRMVRGAL